MTDKSAEHLGRAFVWGCFWLGLFYALAAK